MKFLFDFFPILAFFIAFKVTGDSESGIYTATAVLMAASFIQITVYWLMYRRFEKMHLITLGVVLLFGGATLLLHDERFIQWKPTVVLWIFAMVALGSQYIGQKNVFQRFNFSLYLETKNIFLNTFRVLVRVPLTFVFFSYCNN